MSPLFVLNSYTVGCSSEKSFRPHNFFLFCSILWFCVFEPFPTMTVWFWDPSFHTEENWGTHMQLLQKIQTLTDAPEGKPHLILSFGKHETIYWSLRRAVLNGTIIFRQNKKNVHSVQKLNAWFFLLENQWAYEPSAIVILNVKRWISKSYHHTKSLLERVQIHKYAGKPKN